jgi:pimeloyl-ACP methyl ester carboxylesterase
VQQRRRYRRPRVTGRLLIAAGALVAGVVAAGVAVAQSGGGGARPVLLGPHPCGSFTCSTLRVPLDDSGRIGGSLRLAVAVRGDPGNPVLVVLTGGPGQPGVPYAERMASRLSGVLGHYRLVLLDQRGTGAGALSCPALQAVMGASDLSVPSAQTVRACAVAIGAKRRYYTTADTVADLDRLRRALGVEKIAIDGVSYGTYVAERYALAHPKNVDRLVLDSVVSHVGLDPLVLASIRATPRVLRDACRARNCGTDPAADLAAIVAKQHNGPELLDTLVILSIVDPDFHGVPEALHAARKGDTTWLDTLVGAVDRGKATPAASLSQGLHAATLCGDLTGPWRGPSTPLASRERALNRVLARLRPRDVWPFDRATAGGTGIVRTCLSWPPTPIRAASVAPKLPRVPVLLLAGDRDLSTPLAWAREEARRAPLGRLVVVHGSGHSVQSRGRLPQGREAVRKFLLER